MEITGKITGIREKTGSSSKGFWRKVFVVVQYEDGQYPHQMLLSNMNKAEDFAKLRVGQTCKFKFDGKVNDNNGNYYQDLICWAWDVVGSSDAPSSSDEPF